MNSFQLASYWKRDLAVIRHIYLELEVFNHSQGCFVHDFRNNLCINSSLKAFLEVAQN